MKIKPLEFPVNMERGIFGHSLCEAFFKAMQDGKSYEECCEATNVVLIEGLANPELLKAYRLVLAYGAFVFTQPWKIIEVEVNRLEPVNEEDEFAYTPDLIFEWTSGVKRGTRGMIDFKFTGQYWTDKEIGVYQQLPKYMIYYNKSSKVKVRNIGLVMLNTRAAAGATGTDLFLTKWISTDKPKLKNIERENEIMMQRVKHVKLTYKEEDYLRTVNTFTCKMCFFAEHMCPMQLNGQDTTRVEKYAYEDNTYFDSNYETVAIQ
jgi:hypothetical protein